MPAWIKKIGAVVGLVAAVLTVGYLLDPTWYGRMQEAEWAAPLEAQREACENGASDGNYVAAIALCETALATLKSLKYPPPLVEATLLNELSRNHYDARQSEPALRFGKASLALQKPDGRGLAEVSLRAETLNNLGRVYYRFTEDYDTALDYFKQAMVIWEKTDGAVSRSIAASINNLGVVYYSRDAYDSAEKQFQASLTMREQLLRDAPDERGLQEDVIEALLNMASTVEQQQRYLDADAWWSRCLEKVDAWLPENHPDRVQPYLYAGEAYYERSGGRAQMLRALALLQKAVDVTEHTPGAPSLLRERALRSLADVYESLSRPKEAAAARKRI
ncbi:MAG: tetratricopeptide repeat protein [Pseudomonadota bacterium]